MTLLEIYTEVLNKLRMEPDDMEPNIKAQIYHSINEAYKIVSGKVKQVTIDYIPVIQGIVELPKNIIGTIEFEPQLDAKLDRLVGEKLKTRREDGEVFTIKYYATPTKLENDTESPNIPERMMEALIVFPCYVYFVSKKRIDLANVYKLQFDEVLETRAIDHEDIGNDVIENIYSGLFM